MPGPGSHAAGAESGWAALGAVSPRWSPESGCGRGGAGPGWAGQGRAVAVLPLPACGAGGAAGGSPGLRAGLGWAGSRRGRRMTEALSDEGMRERGRKGGRSFVSTGSHLPRDARRVRDRRRLGRATTPVPGDALMKQHNNPAFRCRSGCPCGSPRKAFPLVTAGLPSDRQGCDSVVPGREKAEHSIAPCKHPLSARVLLCWMGSAVLPGLKEVANSQHINACICTDNLDKKKRVLRAVTTVALI